ncbi:MAG: hypothetical protein ACU83N_07195 [Gammaproteobacteria bacterium]
MKTLLPTVIIGLIVLYFMDVAFHIDDWTMEMFVHNTVRWVAGFVFLGIWVWYKQRLKLKAALYLVLALLVSDDIMDYVRHINSLGLEMIIHDAFMVAWGAMIGFFYMRRLKRGSAP